LSFGLTHSTRLLIFLLQLSVSLLIMNAMGIAALAYASYNNYPGGDALWKLHQQESSVVFRSHSLSNPALVHIDVAAAQQVCGNIFLLNIIVSVVTLRLKGVSRFWQRDLESNQHWKYSKQENITDFSSFHYCISETPTLSGFSVIATANGFHPAMFFSNYVSTRLYENFCFFNVLQYLTIFQTKPAIFVHKRLPANEDEEYN
jgi:hypothetical protein